MLVHDGLDLVYRRKGGVIIEFGGWELEVGDGVGGEEEALLNLHMPRACSSYLGLPLSPSSS